MIITVNDAIYEQALAYTREHGLDLNTMVEDFLMNMNTPHGYVAVNDDKVQTILNEEMMNGGFMSVEEARRLTLQKIEKIYQLNCEL